MFQLISLHPCTFSLQISFQHPLLVAEVPSPIVLMSKEVVHGSTAIDLASHTFPPVDVATPLVSQTLILLTTHMLLMHSSTALTPHSSLF